MQHANGYCQGLLIGQQAGYYVIYGSQLPPTITQGKYSLQLGSNRYFGQYDITMILGDICHAITLCWIIYSPALNDHLLSIFFVERLGAGEGRGLWRLAARCAYLTSRSSRRPMLHCVTPAPLFMALDPLIRQGDRAVFFPFQIRHATLSLLTCDRALTKSDMQQGYFLNSTCDIGNSFFFFFLSLLFILEKYIQQC